MFERAHLHKKKTYRLDEGHVMETMGEKVKNTSSTSKVINYVFDNVSLSLPNFYLVKVFRSDNVPFS